MTNCGTAGRFKIGLFSWDLGLEVRIGDSKVWGSGHFGDGEDSGFRFVGIWTF